LETEIIHYLLKRKIEFNPGVPMAIVEFVWELFNVDHRETLQLEIMKAAKNGNAGLTKNN